MTAFLHAYHGVDIESAIRESDVDELERVLLSLRPEVQHIVLENLEGLLEIRMVHGYPLTLNIGGDCRRFDLPIDKEMHVEFTRTKVGTWRSDGRSGIPGTLHRYSMVPNSDGACIGIVIRLARAYSGAADLLKKPLDFSAVTPVEPFEARRNFNGMEGALADPTMSMMLVGRPGSRKTTLLRDVARVSSLPEPDGYGLDQLCVYVDTSGEGAGIGLTPHPAIGHALRIEVGKPEWQAERIRIAIRNLTCKRLIVDEVGYNNDVDQIESCANLGVGVFCTLHGDGLRDAVNNAMYDKLFGIQDGKRTGKRVSFKMCLELLDPGRWVLYPDLTESVEDILAGRTPRGLKLGRGWQATKQKGEV